jgi:hypothetical protein
MSITKHVGKIKSTDQRCVIVFMQLPEDKEKALIINTESLPPRYEQMLMDIVQSPEGQQERDLANTMNRRMAPETGRSVLAEFHARGLMRPEPIDNIVMLPRPNTPFALRSILEQMGALSASNQTLANSQAEVKYNPVTANQDASKNEERSMMARNLLMEAEMLQVEANKKREQAYKYAPSLRPQPAQSFPQEQTATTDEAPAEKRGRGRPSNAAKAAAAAAGK